MEEEIDDLEEKTEKRFWEEIFGFISELDIDKRWILRADNDPRAHGSLRIVSHPDCKPGYLKAFLSFVTARRPKTPKEIEKAIKDYDMKEIELEVYSIDEHITTESREFEAPLRDLEKLFKVKIL